MRAGPSFVLEGAAVVAGSGTARERTGVVRSVVRTGPGVYEVETFPISAVRSTIKISPRSSGTSRLFANLEIVSDTLLRVRIVEVP